MLAGVAYGRQTGRHWNTLNSQADDGHYSMHSTNMDTPLYTLHVSASSSGQRSTCSPTHPTPATWRRVLYNSCGTREELKEDCAETCSAARAGLRKYAHTVAHPATCSSKVQAHARQARAAVPDSCSFKTTNLLTNGDFESASLQESQQLAILGDTRSILRQPGHRLSGLQPECTDTQPCSWGSSYTRPLRCRQAALHWSFWYINVNLQLRLPTKHSQVVFQTISLPRGSWHSRTCSFSTTIPG